MGHGDRAIQQPDDDFTSPTGTFHQRGQRNDIQRIHRMSSSSRKRDVLHSTSDGPPSRWSSVCERAVLCGSRHTVSTKNLFPLLWYKTSHSGFPRVSFKGRILLANLLQSSR